MTADLTTFALSAGRYALAGQYGPTPDSVSANDFRKWPVSVQAAFVRSFAGGASPAAILVGRKEDDSKVIATLSAGGGDVALTQAPSAIDTAQGALDVATFMDWPNDVQVFYARANGAGVPTSVTIGPAGATVTATVTRDAFGNAVGVSLASRVDAALLGKPASGLSAEAFFALLPSEQAAYVRANGQIDPSDATATPTLALAGADADGTSILLNDQGRRFAVIVPAATYPGFATPLAGQDSAVKGKDFAQWPREVRRAYVEAQPGEYPKTVVLAGGDSIATVGARGGDVDTVAIPSRFFGTPDATRFLDWPAAAQIAYARRNAENPANPQPLVLAGRNGQSLTVGLAPAPAGLTLATTPMPGLAPGDVDLDLFQLWPTAAQVAYLAANGSLTPKSLVLGSDAGLLTLGAGGLPEIDPFPAAFGTAPASLAPATFLGWSPAAQARYLDRNGTTAAGTRSVTIGDPARLPITVSATASGALQITSDTLRIDSSKAMTLQLPNPTANIYGSGGQNLDPNRASAQAVFPLSTSLTAADFPDEPAGTVDTKAVEDQLKKAPSELTVQQFQAWNPATQRAYLLGRVPAPELVPIKNPDPNNAIPVGYIPSRRLEIGSGDAKITVFCSGEPARTVYTAERITQADAIRMSNQDQYVLAGFLTPAQFGQWHTAAQIAYLKRGGDSTKGNSATIGTGADQITAFVGAGGTKVYTVESLQKTDIGKMTSADQAVLASLDAFTKTGGKREALGLTLTRDAAKLLVRSLLIGIDPTKKSTNETAVAKVLKGGQTAMPPEDRAIFVKELDLLSAKIDNGSAFAPSDLNAQIQEIQDRFERVNCFAVNVYGPEKNETTYGWSGLESGYKTFMAQETQLLNLAQNRQALAERTDSGKLDVPNLVYLFQLYSNLAGEAKIRADTEEINQTNELLKIYGKAQSRVNEILQKFTPEQIKNNNELSLDNVRPSTDNPKTVLVLEDISIKDYFSSTYRASPIERLANLTRPAGDFGARISGNWTLYNQQLTDHVSLINQQSQIKMNTVNSQTKAKDRNFDLANNALSKMNEIVQKIAST